jgi:hypothetical protein
MFSSWRAKILRFVTAFSAPSNHLDHFKILALDHISRLIKTPKLLGLLPDEIFKALMTISIINPDDTIVKNSSMSELEIRIKKLQGKKEKGKLSKKQK